MFDPINKILGKKLVKDKYSNNSEKGDILMSERGNPLNCPYCHKSVQFVTNIGKTHKYMWACDKCKEEQK